MAVSESIIVDYEEVSYKSKAQDFAQRLPRKSMRYVGSFFPIVHWIHKYNMMWLLRDLIAGITVGIVVVPQSMGYAKIAELPAEYGLYTAFVGLAAYCFFATSKDISIGPTAVMSLLLGQTIIRGTTAEGSTVTGPEIAVTFSVLAGAVILFIGLVRLGILVDFIPAPVIAGFMTGSAITITFSQLKSLTGIESIHTQDPAYLTLGNFFKNIPEIKLDVAFGVGGLIWLYGVSYGCSYLSRKYPRYSTHLFMFSIMRNGILVIVGTLISFLINIGKNQSPIDILKEVPAGFTAMGVPHVNNELLSIVAPSLPSGVIVLILEHVAIAKSFGRLNDYTISPSQEISAIGFTNIIAAFFGAYPSTGSFSRTAILSRSGVKTPLSGVFSAAVVLLALYALTPAFYYIPSSILAAVVIHAVANLVSGPAYIKRLASVSLWELFIFTVAVVVTFFSSVEYGIYASVALAIVILLFRIARPRFWPLGRIPLAATTTTRHLPTHQYLYVAENHPSLGDRVEPLPAGILMCRVDESFTYPNSSYISEKIISYCKRRTQRSGPKLTKQQRAWNDDAAEDDDVATANQVSPRLHALIIDFSSVNRLDSSGLQALVDAQNTLNRYSGHHIEFHFVTVLNPSIRRTLIVAGFGTQPTMQYLDEQKEVLPVVPQSRDQRLASSGEQEERSDSSTSEPDVDKDEREKGVGEVVMVEDVVKEKAIKSASRKSIPLPKDRYPFFHWSSDEAVMSAMLSKEARGRREQQQQQDDEGPEPQH
ncbi:sulfate transporter family-domain-containing protein [Zychaea mexicana]|uniref:sulfate transporter family-domain-containing protein n=1 Tax=Zychaea mexicana TaxID=64656 RepID=UPI0022FEDD99|nr:sulfate transporter family-domain-containing protein [Zychaea mexicana]KAI9496122.1 sulfate transporter family-domain-containing protein [Zychaea mexicana]